MAIRTDTFLYFTSKGLHNRNGYVGYKDIEIYLRIIRPNPTCQITARDLIRLNLVRNQARPGLESGLGSGQVNLEFTLKMSRQQRPKR